MAYLSTADAKIYLGISSTDSSEDTLVASLLLGAQSDIEVACGRVFEAATLTKYYRPESIGGLGVQVGRELILDADLLSVTTLTNGDAVVLGSSTYVLLPRNESPYNRIRLKTTSIWTFTDDDSWVSVLGSWGYATTAPAVVVQAMREYVHYLYHSPDALKQRTQGSSRADVLPEHIEQLLSSVRKRTT
jgi:hypothetical protein